MAWDFTRLKPRNRAGKGGAWKYGMESEGVLGFGFPGLKSCLGIAPGLEWVSYIPVFSLLYHLLLYFDSYFPSC